MSNDFSSEQKQGQEQGEHKSIEDQKTRLWALSFESTKQLVRCEKCGTTNVIPRLVADPAAFPRRRASDRVEFERSKVAENIAEQKHNNLKAVWALSALSASLSIAVVALLLKRK